MVKNNKNSEMNWAQSAANIFISSPVSVKNNLWFFLLLIVFDLFPIGQINTNAN
jgi:hypothetical protein